MKRKFSDELENIEVSLTPLIDTALVLLIVFMVSMPPLIHSFKVTLPSGKNNEYREEKNDIFVAINQYNKIFLEKDKSSSSVNIQIKEEDLYSKIIYQHKKYSHLAVVLFVDKDASCGFVFELIDSIRALGVTHVYCKTKKITL